MTVVVVLAFLGIILLGRVDEEKVNE